MDQPRTHHVPIHMQHRDFVGRGLGWHGSASVVGAPRRSSGYAVVAPPRIRGRGTPNAARSFTRTGSYPAPTGRVMRSRISSARTSRRSKVNTRNTRAVE